ncbi:MAG: diacylglycerol kinase family protein [Planctomycetota bacterium]
MSELHIDVIATTISGSIRDWGKVERIVPLFRRHGFEDVLLSAVDSHRAARDKACECARSGGRLLISAGGSGTFNAVLAGCLDSGADLSAITLGFLRKGSADLIGKTLGMPDEIEAAIEVFAAAIRRKSTVPCDILAARSAEGQLPARHFVGYGGAEIFGAIPRYTENRFIKYYKGVLGQLFGDLGPFFVGTNLAILGKIFSRLGRPKRTWQVLVDDAVATSGSFQAMIILNGDLGPDLPFARGVPLGSGDFYVFTLRDLGIIKLYRQLRHAWDASILKEPERWGFEAFRVQRRLTLRPDDSDPFPLNTDGSALVCRGAAHVEIEGQIRLLSAPRAG